MQKQIITAKNCVLFFNLLHSTISFGFAAQAHAEHWKNIALVIFILVFTSLVFNITI
jgi:hypothetical protein